MPKLYMFEGLPASGKTTHAKFMMSQAPNQYKRINKDDLRALLDNGVWSKENEQFVLKVRDFIIHEALKLGKDVIVDDTNLHPKHRTKLSEIACQHTAEFCPISFLEIPLETCIMRDNGRKEGHVGEGVIRDMHKRYLQRVPQQSWKKATPGQKAIICDLDGTLAHHVARGPYDWAKVLTDKLDVKIARMLNLYKGAGYELIFLSGRDGSCFKDTEKWLATHGFAGSMLCMRPAGDTRKDAIVKEEIYRRDIEDKYSVEFVLDDRNQVVDMWRKIGLKCLQVEPGNF